MRKAIVLVVLAAAVGAIAAWRGGVLPWSTPVDTTLLYGNVDIRQLDLAFDAEGRLIKLTKQEGDQVAAGETVGMLDADLYRHGLALTQANLAAARAKLAELEAGSRPEEITRAQADVAGAKAALVNAEQVFRRRQALAQRDVVAQQALDDARAALDQGKAKLAAAEQTLTLLVKGPRVEQIEQARAQVAANEAEVALVRSRLDRAELVSPASGIVLTRVVEPGTVLLPTSPVLTMALTGEVYVRSFVPETMLGLVAPGRSVAVFSDTRPDRLYRGTIGFVSPTAEFTPRTVETPELRTQLVYRIRVRVDDPDDGLRQGMPVTIKLSPAR